MKEESALHMKKKTHTQHTIARNKKHTKPIWPIKGMNFQLGLVFSCLFCCCFLAAWCCSFVHGYLHNGYNILRHRIFDVLIKNQSVTKDSLGRLFFFKHCNHSHNRVLCITMSRAFVELVQQQRHDSGSNPTRTGKKPMRNDLASEKKVACETEQYVLLRRQTAISWIVTNASINLYD